MINIIFIISILILFFSIFIFLKLKKEENTKKTEELLEKLRLQVSQEMSQNRKENYENSKNLRQELITTLNDISKTINDIQKNQFDSFSLNFKNLSETQIKQLDVFSKNLNNLSKTNEEKFNEINKTLKEEIRFLQEENSKKLEKMRETVDEKLQSTLEKRLTESFKTVSSQLENVYKGLGEMQNLATDVGDLKRVLTNVKSRGIFGELQLKNILEDILTNEQYEENVKIKNNLFVEFAIKIPSKDDEGKSILLPLDSKFPREDYEKIISAQEKGNKEELDNALKSLKSKIISEAKDIKEKYINPPYTTNFAIMFVPTESLFAEILRIPDLFEKIRKDYDVIITGPTTITAILNSLQMGFRTLNIEKRASHVWKVLGSVKTEFEKFGTYLNKTKEKLQQATNNIELAEKRTQMIGKKLKDVEGVNSIESSKVLELENEYIEENDNKASL